MGKGICRSGDTAYVDYGRSAQVAIPRWCYERNGYQPPFHRLPTQAELLKESA